MFRINRDEILERLSKAMPLGLGRAHARAIASRLNRNARSCLDIGCGRGAFKSLKYLRAAGCDIYQPSLVRAREKGYYENLLRCDARYLPFKAKSFDVALCVEVIEHLDKTEGEELLRRMEEVAGRQIIVTTPWGFCPLEERYDNPYLNHRSAWLPEEFEEMGYEVYPFYYPRYPMGSGIYQTVARYILSFLLYPLIRLFPSKLALDFLAVKELS